MKFQVSGVVLCVCVSLHLFCHLGAIETSCKHTDMLSRLKLTCQSSLFLQLIFILCYVTLQAINVKVQSGKICFFSYYMLHYVCQLIANFFCCLLQKVHKLFSLSLSLYKPQPEVKIMQNDALENQKTMSFRD